MKQKKLSPPAVLPGQLDLVTELEKLNGDKDERGRNKTHDVRADESVRSENREAIDDDNMEGTVATDL